MTKSKCAQVALTRLSLAATGGILLFFLMTRPSPGLEVWEQLLGVQLVEEQRCVLAGTIFVREMPTREGVTLSGRARCFDGRQFDFSQKKPHLKFVLRACDPVAC